MTEPPEEMKERVTAWILQTEQGKAYFRNAVMADSARKQGDAPREQLAHAAGAARDDTIEKAREWIQRDGEILMLLTRRIVDLQRAGDHYLETFKQILSDGDILPLLVQLHIQVLAARQAPEGRERDEAQKRAMLTEAELDGRMRIWDLRVRRLVAAGLDLPLGFDGDPAQLPELTRPALALGPEGRATLRRVFAQLIFDDPVLANSDRARNLAVSSLWAARDGAIGPLMEREKRPGRGSLAQHWFKTMLMSDIGYDAGREFGEMGDVPAEFWKRAARYSHKLVNDNPPPADADHKPPTPLQAGAIRVLAQTPGPLKDQFDRMRRQAAEDKTADRIDPRKPRL